MSSGNKPGFEFIPETLQNREISESTSGEVGRNPNEKHYRRGWNTYN